jgi:GT2 family glycosyltransferase
MDTNPICIVIPCFNGWRYTKSCLISIYKSNYNNFKIIIVNDGSTDMTVEHLKSDFPEILVINGDGNLWWTKSMNIGIRKALDLGYEQILILNNDVIISENCITALIECSFKFPNSIIGSFVYESYDHNKIWSAGGKIKWPWPGEYQIGIGEIDNQQYDVEREVDWLPGMGTLISGKIIKELNYFDSKYMPQYLSDADFCLRAKKAGFNVLVTSNSKIYNSTENTGGITDINKKFKFKDLKDVLFNFKSPDYIVARSTFIYRHCQWYNFILAISIKYTRILIFVLRRAI